MKMSTATALVIAATVVACCARGIHAAPVMPAIVPYIDYQAEPDPDRCPIWQCEDTELEVLV